jgi:hypothetical protein
MALHGNAALSWSGRRELARRVVEQGWTLTAAAMARSATSFVLCMRQRPAAPSKVIVGPRG